MQISSKHRIVSVSRHGAWSSSLRWSLLALLLEYALLFKLGSRHTQDLRDYGLLVLSVRGLLRFSLLRSLLRSR